MQHYSCKKQLSLRQTEIESIIGPMCSKSQQLELIISVFGYLLPTSAFKGPRMWHCDQDRWEKFSSGVCRTGSQRTLAGQIGLPLRYSAIYDTMTDYAITTAHRGIKLQAYLNQTNTSCQHSFLGQSIKCQLLGMWRTALVWEGQRTKVSEGTLPI